jgi:hypothetical protein
MIDLRAVGESGGTDPIVASGYIRFASLLDDSHAQNTFWSHCRCCGCRIDVLYGGRGLC